VTGWAVALTEAVRFPMFEWEAEAVNPKAFLPAAVGQLNLSLQKK
jgi:hypothetical protein